MPVLLDPKSPKRHVNLSLREDLYAVAQDSASAAGLSVSALVERWLLAIALQGAEPAAGVADAELESLCGMLSGASEALSKQEARALRHEARIRKGGL